MPSFLRIAHVHLMRTGGTWLNVWLTGLLRQRSRQDKVAVHNSWWDNLNRDWCESELRSFTRETGSVYVHNHVRNWTRSLVEEYQHNGFFLFAFVRPLGDQLCSLYSWIRQQEPGVRTVSLDVFLENQLAGKNCLDFNHRHWAVPEYWRRLDFVDVFSRESVERLLGEHLRLPLPDDSIWEQPINNTNSPGYARCCEEGLIRAETQRQLQSSRFQQHYDDVLAAAGENERASGLTTISGQRPNSQLERRP